MEQAGPLCDTVGLWAAKVSKWIERSVSFPEEEDLFI